MTHKSEWQHSTESVGRYAWLEHQDNPSDKQIWGHNGFVFQTSERGRYGVYVFSARLANSRLPADSFTYTKGCEVLTYVGTGQLRSWLSVLRVPKTASEQIGLVNAYGTGQKGRQDD